MNIYEEEKEIMRGKMFEKLVASGIAMVMGAALLTGCAGSEATTIEDEEVATSAEAVTAEAKEKEDKAAADSEVGAPYFTKGEDLVYSDANGWSVKYNPSVITVNQSGPITSFVYTGESAGTNMVMVTYDVGKDAKTAIADTAKSWGEKATTSEGVFPGTEDVKGYWAILPPATEGSGLYETAVARDYMDGYLVFELIGHNSGNEELDMAVSDALATIIDSLQFTE